MKRLRAGKVALYVSLCLLSVMIIVSSSMVAAQEKITLRMGHALAPSHNVHTVSVWMSEELAKQTDGKVTMEVYHSSTLGSGIEVVEGVVAGTIDMLQDGGPSATFWSKFAVIDLPYLIEDQEHWERVFFGPPGEELANGLLENAGIRILGWWPQGFRNVLSGKPIPVLKPEDLAGQKIRLHASPVPVATFKALGASPIPMAFGEVYTSLRSGVIDAMEGTFTAIQAMKFAEVAKYFAHTKHFYLTCYVGISEKRFQSLPPDIQETLLEVGKESQQVMIGVLAEDNAKAMEAISKLIRWETYPNIELFREKVKPVWDNFSTETGAEDWIDGVGRLR